MFSNLFILNVLSRSFLQNWQTSGVDLAVKVVNIPDTDTAVELYLYDTSGADLYSQMRSPLVRWSSGIRPDHVPFVAHVSMLMRRVQPYLTVGGCIARLGSI